MGRPEFENLCFRALHGGLGDVGYQMLRLHLTRLEGPGAWAPAVNAFRCRDAYVLCVALAGVSRGQISLQIEPRRVRISGVRSGPDPGVADGPLEQVLAMEIDHGPFLREVILPASVDPELARAEHRQGFLWVHLPFAGTRRPEVAT